jgi:hypothetical protein
VTPARVPRYDRGLARLDFAPDAQVGPGVAPAKTDPTTGYVRAHAYLARDGKLVYGDGAEQWEEIRPREELERAALSFATAPLTDLHPDAMVTADTWEDVARGMIIGQPSVTEPDEDGTSYLAAELLITSADMLATIKDGQTELSIGFWARIVDAPAETGARFAQVDLLGNHVASVPRGRAGPACRVFLDSLAICAYDRPVSQETHDAQAVESVEYPMPDGSIVMIPTPVAQLIAQMQGTIAELSEKATAEPEAPEPPMQEQPADPNAETQPDAQVPPEAQPGAAAQAAAVPPEEEDKRRDSVRVDRESAVSLIEARMPHMKGKTDGLDLATLFAAALAMPEPKRDAAAPNPYAGAEPVNAEPRKDETNAPVAHYLTNVVGLKR